VRGEEPGFRERYVPELFDGVVTTPVSPGPSRFGSSLSLARGTGDP
jgi:hypothetical protein